jgi:DNA-binding CsgD family transcriptional regulator
MLHGRRPERARLDAFLAGVREGRGETLVIRGEAGAGKSTLLAYARERAQGFRVLETVGIEAESDLAYGGLHQLIRPLLSRLSDLRPAHAAALRSAIGLESGDQPDRFLVGLALLTLLSEAARERPILCLIDDARWLDGPTASALVFVARRVQGERVGMLVADRDPGPSLFDVPGLTQMRLEGLDAEAAAQLLAEAAPVPVQERVALQLTARTAGNPLAIAELPQLLTPDQLAGRTPLPDPLPIGEALEGVFLERVREMPEATQRLLLVAAAADSPELLPVLAGARRVGVDPDALQPAEAARLVRARTGQVTFRHPLIRAAVYHGATSADRKEAHLALASALERNGDADRRAWHRAAATTEPDEEVARDLEGLAQRARLRGALASAVTALRRAAQLTAAREDRGRRLAAAGRAAYLAGHGELARALLRDADPLLRDPAARANAALTLGEIHLINADAGAGLDVLAQGAREVATIDPGKALDLLVPASLLAGLSLAGDPDGLVRQAEGLPGEGDAAALEFMRSTAHLARHSLADSGRLHMPDPPDALEPLPARRYWIATTACHPTVARRPPDALTFLSRLATVAREHGLAIQLTAVLIAVAYGEFQGGRFASTRADAGEALELARDTGQVLSVRLAAAVLALVAAVQGRADESRRLAAQALHQTQDAPRWAYNAASLWAQGLAALSSGDPEAAVPAFGQVTPGGRLEQHWVTPLATPDFVEAAAWAERPEEARDAAAAFEAWAQRFAPPHALALSARCRAILADDPDEAAREYETALRLHTDTDRPFDRARTRLLYGELLRRTRRRTESRHALRRALQFFEQAGAEPWAERARRELRATGQSLRRRDPQALDLLTPQELQIARYVARGNTNKDVAAQLFLSPRTVASHLQSIFRKLGIVTRTELARYDFEGETTGD